MKTKKKVYWAKSDKEFIDFLHQALSKTYQKQVEILEWLNFQSLQVDVAKN